MASDPQVPIMSSCLDFPQLWTVIRIVSQTLFSACCFWPQCFLTAIGNKIKWLSCEVKNKSPWVGSLLQGKFAYGSECNFFFAAIKSSGPELMKRKNRYVSVDYVCICAGCEHTCLCTEAEGECWMFCYITLLYCKSLTELGARLAGSQHPPISFLYNNGLTGAHNHTYL